MHDLGVVTERPARPTPQEMVFELGVLDAGLLAVEVGRDRSSERLTAHARVVDLSGAWVPRYRPAVDRLTSLLVQAREGDRVALGSAIRLGQGEVWRLASHLVGPNEADDVTQDTFVRVWRALPSFRAESSGRTWLLSIARRACVDAVRRKSRWHRLTARVHADATVRRGDASAFEDLNGLRDLVARLPPSQREAFVLTQITGCSYAEAAELCDVRIGTIRSRVARARLELIALVRDARAV
jgi:RNA polymerase sigma-70 factor (ECF subfamily)